ncbi:hypothetical protein B5I05_18980, partial [Shigella dysenteriae]|nr:hypothetical protein [Shigella dysenteriae]EFZ0105395.1 hypothetical protein [Shigella dysenteriae]EFZ0179868.1 hypothetical protein [Shigella dysenteriae]EGE2378653.1 hypothetical protein [Shigella dysenteriae]
MFFRTFDFETSITSTLPHSGGLYYYRDFSSLFQRAIVYCYVSKCLHRSEFCSLWRTLNRMTYHASGNDSNLLIVFYVQIM